MGFAAIDLGAEMVRPLLLVERMRWIVVVVVVAMASVARAQPALTPPIAPAAEAPAQFYAETGAAVGVGIGIYAAWVAELGYRPGGGSLSIHATVQSGSVPLFGAFDEHVTSSGYLALRSGVDERGCAVGGVWCGFVGIDLGYLHQYATTSGDEHRDERVAVVVPHVGFDVGGRRVRLRVGFEAARGWQDYWEALGLTAGLAYSW